jgi:2-aminobenzoate-CoA ligase
MPASLEQALPPKALWPERIYTLPETRYPVRLNAARELLDVHADGSRAGRPAIHFQDQVITYGELQRRVNRLAHGLRGAGIDAGDRLLIRLPNCPEFIMTWLACLKIGAIAVPTMPLLRARELSAVANDAGAVAAVAAAGLRDELDRARADAPALKRLIVAGESRGADLAWESLMDGQPDRFTAVETRAHDVAMIAYTSGSTGAPKGCVHQHIDVLAAADSYARYILTPSEDDRFGGHPTLAFTFGTGGLMIYPFRFGASTVLTGHFQPEAMLEAIARYRITLAFCAATSYRLMLRLPDMERRFDVGSLRLCATGGEPLAAPTYTEWLRRTGREILEGIGSTEMTHNFISSVSGRVRPGATGFAVPGYDCRIVNERGQEVSRGTPGLLAIKGPTGCKYWSQPNRQAQYVRFGGWNVPGDLFVQDDEGYFIYQCRTDDMILCGGYKIPGPEVEHVLNEHGAVAESAVVSTPDEARGSVPKAFVVLAPGFQPSAALVKELQDYVKAELAPYKYPRQVEFVSELPRTVTGKLRRATLRDRESARPTHT